MHAICLAAQSHGQIWDCFQRCCNTDAAGGTGMSCNCCWLQH
jgi:hypothetical protein